jgi:hypothetical protein
MPVRHNTRAHYYQWGTKAKYYYKPGNVRQQVFAYLRATAQGRAVYARRRRGSI